MRFFGRMDKQRRKGFETLGQAARRLLETLDERRKASGRLQGPGEFEPEAISREDSDQRSGIRAEVTRDGRVKGFASGVALIEKLPGFRESHMRPLATDADSYVTEFTVPAKGNAHRIGLRMRLAADARPGDGMVPRRPRIPADNCNRRDHAGTLSCWS